ncbi:MULTISPECIES: response regulator transcription factor [Carnobacterium]|jgi:DNA-binding response OmpR family regulator|uniref:Response regulator n=1 Tax=Carnobacterium maltaromaticum LMA28 TaxID=1234679 RepID=K8E584_CARML|nr:response regulator transcription factor [Carnobacterium maltaromaticum]KRN68464.1 two-component response regulator [Carnobacterium maltaromaticum DSM 20342]MBC9809919.1 response regulator [Carnobacterium maltaromaticum]CCO11759.2 response regulator [Carnobacterium maltaromaticum LMA28]
MKILIVDDEPKILEIVDAYLISKNYSVYKATSGKEALEKYHFISPDLVILDLMLPDISGLDVCETIRKETETPIIMLTAKSGEEDILKGLALGADDYIVKPFSPKELVARVETVLRRSSTFSSHGKLIFNDGELIIIPSTRQVFLTNNELALTSSEFDILAIIASNPNRIFSRSQLIEIVKGMEFSGLERTIDSHIKNLRHKIEKDPKKPNYIVTVHGSGYRFGEGK